MSYSTRHTHFNLESGLKMLFVDVDEIQNRPKGRNDDPFFESDTIMWGLINEYVTIPSINADNITNTLRGQRMGYLYLAEKGIRWENMPSSEQSDAINEFKEQVRTLKPYIVVAIGRKTYNAITSGEGDRINGKMACGYRKKVITWKKGSFSKGSTKIFLMRKTAFAEESERRNCGKKLQKSLKFLESYEDRHSMNIIQENPSQQQRQQLKINKRSLSEFLDDVIDDDRRKRRRSENRQEDPIIPESDDSSSEDDMDEDDTDEDNMDEDNMDEDDEN